MRLSLESVLLMPPCFEAVGDSDWAGYACVPEAEPSGLHTRLQLTSEQAELMEFPRLMLSRLCVLW